MICVQEVPMAVEDGPFSSISVDFCRQGPPGVAKTLLAETAAQAGFFGRR